MVWYGGPAKAKSNKSFMFLAGMTTAVAIASYGIIVAMVSLFMPKQNKKNGVFMLTKKAFSKFAASIGSLTAVIAPVVTTVAYQNKSSTETATPNILNNSSLTALAKTNDLPFIMCNPYTLDEDGFVQMMNENQSHWQSKDLVLTENQMHDWYKTNNELANVLIAYANVHLNERSFWSTIGSFFTGVGKAIASGGAYIVGGISGNQNIINWAQNTGESAGKDFEDFGRGAFDLATGVVGAAVTLITADPGLGKNIIDWGDSVTGKDFLADVKDLIGLDFKDITKTDWVKFGTFVFTQAATAGIGGLVESAAEEAIASGISNVVANFLATSFGGHVAGHIIVKTAEEYSKIVANEYKQVITKADNTSGVKPGTYYAVSEDNKIKFQFVFE